MQIKGLQGLSSRGSVNSRHPEIPANLRAFDLVNLYKPRTKELIILRSVALLRITLLIIISYILYLTTFCGGAADENYSDSLGPISKADQPGIKTFLYSI